VKARINTLITCMLAVSLGVSSSAVAQQPNAVQSVKPSTVQMAVIPAADGYAYRLFIAPNKVYGYDIFQNGRMIFHQPAAAEPAGDKKTGLTKKAFADKAALLAIEKIKKGATPELSRAEIVRIATQ
jgi:hypothetical protein